MGFKELLQEELGKNSAFPSDLSSLLPRGFQELNRRAIFQFKPELKPYTSDICEAIHNLIPRLEAIWVRSGWIEGKFREPSGLTLVWGDPTTEITINENKVRYRFDFTKIMFAKGNVHERALLPTHIKPGEVIVDMFSGIGYFTLGIAKTRKPSKMYSIEWNPTSYKYLCENLKLNKVDDLVTPIFGDCRDKVRELYDQGLKADRVIMGLLPAPVNCISAALLLVKPEGSIIVYEGIERRESTKLFDEFTEIATQDGFKCEIIDRRIVKAFKPHEYHVVIEILVKSL